MRYDYEVPRGSFWFANPPAPRWLRTLLGDAFFLNVTTARPGEGTADAFLECVEHFPQLRGLVFEGYVADASLVRWKD